ncbi:MAG: PKD domain-containing protein, partial [Bacteroidota bacterium]|nr:PKD domain-containing protein [Bacteroidota bacterium]
MVWYPYGESKEFPLVGEGGRNAMAGPVFYHDLFEFSDVKFSKYYHRKLFIYDWMRDWIMAVTMNKKGDFERMEPFMPNTVFNKPVDMEFGKDGALYVLEYGTYWNSQNDDARLSRIEYNEGNRKPIAKASVNKTRSAAPATLQFSAKGSFDYDKGDTLSYEWSFDQPGIVQSTEINPAYTFTKPGKYKPALKVKDSEGKESDVILEVEIGNEPPEVSINFMNNRSFFWHNTPINYEVAVKDKEDGSLQDGSIKPGQVTATMFYLEQGFDQIEAAQGHQLAKVGKHVTGKTLIEASDCKACHAVEKSSVGPSYNEVAKRYNANSGAIDQLTTKIINGGSGSWGDRMMPPHLQLSKEDANEMVQYILSLAQEEQEEANQQIAWKGSIVPDKQVNDKEGGAYILTASYTDKGAAGMPPAQGREEIVIRHAKVLAANADDFKGTAKANNERSRLI